MTDDDYIFGSKETDEAFFKSTMDMYREIDERRARTEWRSKHVRQLEIYEVRTDDGGVGLKFGDGPIFMGYDGDDLMRLMGAIFTDNGNVADWTDLPPIDGDLIDLAHHYLDGPMAAYERQHALNEAAGWREW